MLRRSLRAIAIATLLSGTAVIAAQAHMMAAIDDTGNLLRFSDKRPHVVEKFPITGTSARIVGIDVRRSDKELYGLARDGTVYRIDSTNGRATYKTRLGGDFSNVGAVDFDPDDDRLYIMTTDGRTWRANIETGEITGLLQPGIEFGSGHRFTAAGFTSAQFFAIDSGRMALFQQPGAPQQFNTTLRRDISLTGGTDDLRGGDVVVEPNGNQSIYIVRGPRLYRILVSTGQIEMLGQVGTEQSLNLIDIAMTSPE